MGVLKYILDKRFFEPWREGATNERASIWKDANLELFITSQCNQHCEYCYLVKHEELFPRSLWDTENIKSNLRTFLDWMLKEGFSVNKVDLFSGEIWHTQFGWDILDIILDYIRRGLKIGSVMVPTNASFVMSDKALVQIANRIENYRASGVFLQFSGSVDGALSDGITRIANSGAVNAEKQTDEFYDRFFSFWKHYGFRFHPMVSASNVRYWIENFQWWERKCAEYGYDAFEDVMMLEVRNDDWTDESIADYTKFLGYLVDRDLKRCGSAAKLADRLFLTDIFSGGSASGYVNYGLTPADNFQGCTVSDQLCVRLGDLAIPACHRTAYDELLYGRFVVENGEITGIEENNAQMASRVYLQNSILCTPGCDCCPYNYFCMRGCYGSQYEAERDPFMPIESVCRLFKAKTDFLIRKYEETGVMDELRKVTRFNARYESVKATLDAVERVKGAWAHD